VWQRFFEMFRHPHVWLFAIALVTSCAPPAPPETLRPPAPPAVIYEEEVKPVELLKLDIIDLNDTPSPDRKTVTVTGTVINHGARTTREVYVHVEALDKDGAVVVSAAPNPSTQAIASESTATFSATFENQPSIDRYHVEALGR
jgi:hypothetical protein